MVVVKHKDLLILNIEFHKINACYKLDCHVPTQSLTKVEKGIYYSGITLFNSLPPPPPNIKQVAHDVKFKHKFRRYLILNPLYSIEE
jgi:hypothetical protein